MLAAWHAGKALSTVGGGPTSPHGVPPALPLRQIGSMVETPGYWLQMLGAALPSASSYFVNYCARKVTSAGWVSPWAAAAKIPPRPRQPAEGACLPDAPELILIWSHSAAIFLQASSAPSHPTSLASSGEGRLDPLLVRQRCNTPAGAACCAVLFAVLLVRHVRCSRHACSVPYTLLGWHPCTRESHPNPHNMQAACGRVPERHLQRHPAPHS